jgi:hypothetical protein
VIHRRSGADLARWPRAHRTLGFQFTKEFVRFNQTWRMSEVAEAFGEAFNKLLNHLHLGPIVTATYTTTGGGVLAQKNAQKAGTPPMVAYDTSIAKTLNTAMKVLPKGTKILCNSFDTEDILNAIKGDFVPVNNGAISSTPTNLNRAFNQDSFIEYDGTEATSAARPTPTPAWPRASATCWCRRAATSASLRSRTLRSTAATLTSHGWCSSSRSGRPGAACCACLAA